MTRQRPIAPAPPAHCFSTSWINGGRKTRKLLRRRPSEVRNSTKSFASVVAAGLSAIADTLSRSSSSINPSLNDRTGLPAPPAVTSGGWPKRMMNSSLSCVSTVSLPTTATTTLAETSESSLSNEKSSLLNRHFSSPRPEWLTSRDTSSSSMPVSTVIR